MSKKGIGCMMGLILQYSENLWTLSYSVSWGICHDVFIGYYGPSVTREQAFIANLTHLHDILVISSMLMKSTMSRSW